MKTEVKKLGSTKREIDVAVMGDLVKNKFEEVFNQVGKEAKVPGFRPGKAPRELLEKHYGATVHERVIKELVPDVYNQAIEQEKLDVVELPQISQVRLERSSLSFKAVVEVTPEFEIKNYRNRKVSFKPVAVSGDEVKRQLDAIKESRKASVVDDKIARGLGYPSLGDLERSLEAQIFLSKENQQRQGVEKELVDGLIQEVDFKLPDGLLNRQLADMLRQTKLDLAMKGLGREQIESQEKAMLAELKPQAERQVRIYLVLAHIAKKENIPLDEHMPAKVMEFLLGEADWKQEAGA